MEEEVLFYQGWEAWQVMLLWGTALLMVPGVILIDAAMELWDRWRERKH